MKRFNGGVGAICCDGCGKMILEGHWKNRRVPRARYRILQVDAVQTAPTKAGDREHYCTKNCIGRPRVGQSVILPVGESFAGEPTRPSPWTWRYAVGAVWVQMTLVPVKAATPMFSEERGSLR